MTPTERYLRDPHFKKIVDLIYSLIDQAEFTPTELREAVMLAAVQYETMNIKPLYRANEDGSVTVWDRTFTGHSEAR